MVIYLSNVIVILAKEFSIVNSNMCRPYDKRTICGKCNQIENVACSKNPAHVNAMPTHKFIAITR